jgi:hypothetical protein
MIDILGKLLGSPARVKIMRLFLLNREQGFENKDVVRRSKVSVGSARRELAHLASLGFIKKKTFLKEIPGDAKRKPQSKKVNGWFLDPTFPYLSQMTELLIDADFLHKEELVARFKPAGRIKLLIVAGVFIKESSSRVDLLVVGDKLKRPYVENAIKNLEAEIGKELSYAIFETPDFIYRLSMYDKLVRDILDFPHERLVESKELSTRLTQKL